MASSAIVAFAVLWITIVVLLTVAARISHISGRNSDQNSDRNSDRNSERIPINSASPTGEVE